MHSRFLRRSCLTAALVVIVLVVAVCAESAVAQLREEILRDRQMSRLILDRRYHEAEDLYEAAAQLRCDALSQGFELQERPDWGFAPLAGENTDSLTIHAGCGFRSFSATDCSYLEKLTFGLLGPDSNLVISAFVHLQRDPSIGEVSDLLASGTRILCWIESGLFVVAGSECSLRECARSSLLDWIHPSKPDEKRRAYSSGSDPGVYDVFTYLPVRESFENDLKRLGLEVIQSSRNRPARHPQQSSSEVGHVGVRGTAQAADAASAFWWVRCVIDAAVNSPD